MRIAVCLQLCLQALDVRIGLVFGCGIFRLIPQSISFRCHPRASLFGPNYARCCCRQRGIGHAQFGVRARLFGRRIGQCDFALPRLPFGIFCRAQQGRALLLLRFNLLGQLEAFCLQSGKRICRIMRQLAFTCAIFGHARRLRCKVGLALDDAFMFAR